MKANCILTLMGEDAVESPKEMLGKEGDVYKLSMDMEPSGRNNLGCEGHLYIKHTGHEEAADLKIPQWTTSKGNMSSGVNVNAL